MYAYRFYIIYYQLHNIHNTANIIYNLVPIVMSSVLIFMLLGQEVTICSPRIANLNVNEVYCLRTVNEDISNES